MRSKPLVVTTVLVALAAAGLALFARFGPAPDVVVTHRGGEAGECVVLLHGLARTARSMTRLGERLAADGFAVVAVDYPSRHFTIEALAPMALTPALARCRAGGARAVHFVTHSLGGILVRRYLAEHEVPELGRVVMLAPPNHGSEVADAYRGIFLYHWMNGPAGDQLGTDEDAVPGRLGPTDADVAVVAGTASINLILSAFLPNPDDGKVSVASARLEGMCAMLVLDVSHPFIMKDGAVIDEVSAYLTTGRFRSAAAEYPDCGRSAAASTSTSVGASAGVSG